ncbi:MAG TPA: citrate/2-methylcitrate synthase [Blastocatellia bacterium]|nr:citrate/2-methylcitrate synthase [Blastocatellia bacterium]
METKNIGLRGIPVADTKICDIDGQKGWLIYRGYNIDDLAKHSTFEETSYLLLFGDLPTQRQLDDFSRSLVAERTVPDSIIQSLRERPKTAHPMDVLQSVIPMLADYDREARNESRDANIRKAIKLISKTATLVAAWSRIRKGNEPIAPDPRLNHAANFLHMCFGNAPDPETARLFDVCLILHAEHQFNASTFACREVASTHAHMYASIAAGIGALSGELHGGANEQMMAALKKIGELSNVKQFVDDAFANKRKIMAMGHAVYKTRDPRAKILCPMAEQLAAKSGERKWFDMSQELERVARARFEEQGKNVYANVDFYSASTYYMMGFEPDLFTPIFAVARMSGWAAHIIEEKFADAQPKPELYRPEADYNGRRCDDGCAYIPIDQRTEK